MTGGGKEEEKAKEASAMLPTWWEKPESLFLAPSMPKPQGPGLGPLTATPHHSLVRELPHVRGMGLGQSERARLGGSATATCEPHRPGHTGCARHCLAAAWPRARGPDSTGPGHPLSPPRGKPKSEGRGGRKRGPPQEDAWLRGSLAPPRGFSGVEVPSPGSLQPLSIQAAPTVVHK